MDETHLSPAADHRSMLLLPPLTALFLNLHSNDQPAPWMADFSQMQPLVGVPPLGDLMPLSAPDRTKAELQPSRNPPPRPSSRPSSPSPPAAITSAPPPPPSAMDSWEPPTRPSSPLSRQTTDSSGFSSASNVFFEGNASITLNLVHPWLGIIYISSPGFIFQPGWITTNPVTRPFLPQPVTSSEPGVGLSEGYFPVFLYKPGYVTWITYR